jgi:hypothetical protein
MGKVSGREFVWRPGELWSLRPSRPSFERLIGDFSCFRCGSRFDLRPHHQLPSFEAHGLREGISKGHLKYLQNHRYEEPTQVKGRVVAYTNPSISRNLTYPNPSKELYRIEPAA